MKRWYYILYILPLIACEDVVDVDLPEQQPKLIVDALVRLNLEESSSPVRIKVSTTGSFFDEIIPTPLERMQILNEDNGGVKFFIADPEKPNEYVPLNSMGEPEVGDLAPNTLFTEGRVILTFVFEDELYLAETRFAPSTPITSLEQGDGFLLDEDDKEVIVSFTDIPDQQNQYVFDFDFGEFVAVEDRFFQDQDFEFSYFYDKNLESGDTANISILGADEGFYNYMDLLIEQSSLGENGPFQVPVTTVRGNILKVEGVDNIDIFDNVGRPQEFVLGYFAIAQEYKASITIE